jgi:predicted membrane metal-binding protein
LRRALIFFVLKYLGARAGKNPEMLETLAATFFIHVFWKPAEALTVSFLLSYAGLVGLLLLTEPVKRALVRVPYLVGRGELAASAGASVCTAPICGAFFGYLTPGSIISTAVVSPLFTVFTVAGIFAAILSFAIPPLTILVGAVMNVMYTVITFLVGIFARIPQIPV